MHAHANSKLTCISIFKRKLFKTCLELYGFEKKAILTLCQVSFENRGNNNANTPRSIVAS